jgi:hypothetical protein
LIPFVQKVQLHEGIFGGSDFGVDGSSNSSSGKLPERLALLASFAVRRR